MDLCDDSPSEGQLQALSRFLPDVTIQESCSGLRKQRNTFCFSNRISTLSAKKARAAPTTTILKRNVMILPQDQALLICPTNAADSSVGLQFQSNIGLGPDEVDDADAMVTVLSLLSWTCAFISTMVLINGNTYHDCLNTAYFGMSQNLNDIARLPLKNVDFAVITSSNNCSSSTCKCDPSWICLLWSAGCEIVDETASLQLV